MRGIAVWESVLCRNRFSALSMARARTTGAPVSLRLSCAASTQFQHRLIAFGVGHRPVTNFLLSHDLHPFVHIGAGVGERLRRATIASPGALDNSYVRGTG